MYLILFPGVQSVLLQIQPVELGQTQEGYSSFPTAESKNWIFTVQNMYKSLTKIISEGLL